MIGAPSSGRAKRRPLEAAVLTFIEDVEAAVRNQERVGGQHVTFTGPYAHLVPSMKRDLKRQVERFRAALGEGAKT